MVCGIDAYNMITYIKLVELHILFVSIVVFGIISAVRIVGFSRSNETLLLDDTSIVPPNNNEPAIIIYEPNLKIKSVIITIAFLISWSMYNLHKPVISELVYNLLDFNEEKSSILKLPRVAFCTLIAC